MNSSLRVCILLVLTYSFGFAAEPTRIEWLRTTNASAATPAAFERHVFEYLAASGQTWNEATLQDIRTGLRSLKKQQDSLIVLHCSLAEYMSLLKDPEGKWLFADLGLELLNARLLSYPFFLVEAQEPGTKDFIDVAWITMPGSDVHPIQDADLLTMLSEALGRPRNALRVVRERGAYPVAKKLQEGGYRMIGIYEDEPSTLLEEFSVNWDEELRARPFRFHSFEPDRVPAQLVPVATGRFSYSFFQYPERSFDPVPVNTPVLAIAHETSHPFPVLLSNARKSGRGKELRRALSYSYFLMPALPEIRSLPQPDRKKIEQIYLLNSYLEDPSSRTKGLGLLGSFLLRKEDITGRQQREVYGQKCAQFQRQLQIPQIAGDQILRWIGMEATVGRREMFSSDVSRLYEEALQQIELGLAKTGVERVASLEKARTGLAAALLQGSLPRNVQGSRGLWSVADYNPYYHLARVILYLEVEKRRTK